MTNIRIVTCAGGASWEAPLVRGLQQRELGIELLRRCVDHGELLGVSLRDRPTAALIAAELPWLDRDLVGELQENGVTVVAIDSLGNRPLDRLGVSHVLDASQTAEEIIQLLYRIGGTGDDHKGLRAQVESNGRSQEARPCGRAIVIWGGSGAPGRTTVAIELALETARLGARVLLVDADPWSPSIAQTLGLAETPSVMQATKLAADGWPKALSTCLQTRQEGLEVLTGLGHPDLWPEVRAHTWRAVLDAARDLADVVVIDVGASVEEDEELAFDRAPYRRNLMTLGALEIATDVLLVSGSDPVALRRSIIAFQLLQQVRPRASEHASFLLNRAPRSHRRLQECSHVVADWIGAPPIGFLPVEAAFERCVWEARSLRAVAPRSPWLRELRRVAEVLS